MLAVSGSPAHCGGCEIDTFCNLVCMGLHNSVSVGSLLFFRRLSFSLETEGRVTGVAWLLLLLCLPSAVDAFCACDLMRLPSVPVCVLISSYKDARETGLVPTASVGPNHFIKRLISNGCLQGSCGLGLQCMDFGGYGVRTCV